MAVVTMKQLLESGVHFGHQTKRWNPKMKRYIFTERNGIYIIDLQQTLSYIDRAYDFVKETVAHGGSILFIGTKKQAQEAIEEQASRVGMPYVKERWLGGMLTNFSTVYRRLQRLKELEEIELTGGTEVRTKKEQLVLSREKAKLERTLGGIRDMSRVPSAVWIVDTKKEHIAVGEARKLGIPVVAILDTNCDPDEVDYPIPGNDDAIRSATLLTRVVADAVADGLIARAGAATGQQGDAKPASLAGDEPLTEWEQELLRGRGAAATGTAGSATATAESATATAESATETVEPATETVEPATETVEPATTTAGPATESAEPATGAAGSVAEDTVGLQADEDTAGVPAGEDTVGVPAGETSPSTASTVAGASTAAADEVTGAPATGAPAADVQAYGAAANGTGGPSAPSPETPDAPATPIL